MQKWAGVGDQGRPFLHDHGVLRVAAGSKVTAGDRRPYHRRVDTRRSADALRLDVQADAVVLVKRRAVDLCRVAACLCPTP
jgi:hypothetical protein